MRGKKALAVLGIFGLLFSFHTSAGISNQPECAKKLRFPRLKNVAAFLTGAWLSVHYGYVELLAESTVPPNMPSTSLEKINGSVVVVINILGSYNDPVGGNPDHTEAIVANEIRTNHSGNQIVFIREYDPAVIDKKLTELLGPEAIVDGLIVISHGDSQINGQENIETSLHPRYSSDLGPGLRISTSLEAGTSAPSSANLTFAALRDKWGPYAKIRFIACNTASKGTPEQIMRHMTAMSEMLGLTSGSIYMNRTLSAHVREIVLEQDWRSQLSTEMKAAGFLAQALRPVSDGIVSYLDNNVFNQGYLLTVSSESDGSKLYELRETNMNSANSSEVLVVESTEPLFSMRTTDYQVVARGKK